MTLAVLTLAALAGDDWVKIIGAVFGGLVMLAGTVFNGLATVRLRRELHPPSNTVTLGALIEGIGQAQHLANNMIAPAVLRQPDTEIPPAVEIAKELQRQAAAPGPPPSARAPGVETRSGDDRRQP